YPHVRVKNSGTSVHLIDIFVYPIVFY
ncbi:hypothetical protein Gotur_030493, partial [Gossypium turneri]